MGTPPKVGAILEALSHHVPGPSGDVFAVSDCIEELFRALGSEDICETIAGAVEHGLLTKEQGSWFLGVAMWSGETNGAAQKPTIERWLEEAQDPLRIRLALDRDVFPYRSLAEMTHVLSRVMSRQPQLAEHCTRLIEQRRRQGG